jgi:hypothetical protein
MARGDRQMYQLMKEAVVGKRFRDRNDRAYKIREADIHGQEIFVDYDDEPGHAGRIRTFYDCLGDEPLEDTEKNDDQLEVLAETQVE